MCYCGVRLTLNARTHIVYPASHWSYGWEHWHLRGEIFIPTQEENHKRIFWWVLIPSQISPVAGRKVACVLSCFKGLILLKNISWFICLPVQWGSSPVFLSVGGICQLAAGHTFENPHYILINFPPNQYAPSQSRIQSTHNPRFPCNRVEACDLCGSTYETGSEQCEETTAHQEICVWQGVLVFKIGSGRVSGIRSSMC